MNYSLQARALGLATLVFAGFLAGTAWMLEQAFHDSAEAAMRDGLHGYAETLTAAFEKDYLSGFEHLPDTLAEKLAEPSSGLYAILSRRSDGVRVWRSESVKGFDIPWPSLAEFWTAQLNPVVLPGGKSLYILSVNLRFHKPRSRESTAYVLQLAETLDDRESYYYARVRQVRVRLWRWFGATAAALLLLQAVVLSRSFAPLRRVAADLRDIEIGLKDRLSGRYPRELHGLTANLNALLDQADAHLARYRDALGDLAHSMKTPLAVLRGALVEAEHTRAGKVATTEQIDRMARIIEYQLKRASASGRSHLAQPVDVREKLGMVESALKKVYAEKSIEFTNQVPSGLMFRGDEGDLLEILGNLMDNACKWCRSRVSVTGQIDPDGYLYLIVDDDGTGIPPELADRLLERGERADPSSPGHGLGLAIVRSVASTYGGRLSIGQNPWGGASTSLRLQT